MNNTTGQTPGITNTAIGAADPDNVTRLPDGSAFAIASFPLPDSHWLYAPREYADGADVPKELPRPILSHTEHREAAVAAIRYAVRGATMCGKEPDFDPDALVQNAVYALCGPFGGRTTLAEKIALASAPAQPVAEPANAYSVLEDALSDALRVPLDSLHADADYLIGRLRDGSMPYVRVIEIIRERIDAAKAAIRARASHGQAPAGAYENAKLVTLIAKCRDAFPIPAHGDPIENYWSAAIEDPANVPAYLQEIAKRKQADSVQEDAARLDWLEQNLFHREMDEWDVKFGGRGDQNMWVLFAPKGVQGSARRIIDAAMGKGASHDR